jgi:hypothetical protein
MSAATKERTTGGGDRRRPDRSPSSLRVAHEAKLRPESGRIIGLF